MVVMRLRWRWLAGLIAAVPVLWACGPASAQGAVHAAAPAALPCPTTAPGAGSVVCVDGQKFRVMPSGFEGLSFEFDQVRDYFDSAPPKCGYAAAAAAALNPAFVQLVENLSAQPVLRIGGDSSQDVTGRVTQRSDSCPRYAPTATRVPGNLGPGWYQTVIAFAKQTNSQLILDLNQEHGTSLRGAGRTYFPKSSQAQILASSFGPFQVVNHLVQALEIGNEPELYPKRFSGYTTGAGLYYPTFDALRQTIAASAATWGGIPPGIAGPVTGDVNKSAGLTALRKFLGREPAVQMVTVHHYPLSTCGGQHPSTAQLLHAYNKGGKGYYFMNTFIPAAIRAAGLRAGGVRVDELNSVTCQGQPGVSDRFATALWSLEAMFRLAYKGVSGVNIHTQEDANNDPFQPPYRAWYKSPGQSSPGQIAVNPEYYGMYAFAKATPAGSTLMGTSVCCYRNAPDRTNSLKVRAWAAQLPDGTLTVAVLYNSTAKRTVAVSLGPAYANRTAALDCVSASSVSSRTATYDTHSFAPATGAVVPAPQTVGPGRRHLYYVTFTAPGIAILTVSGSTTASGPSSGTCSP